MAGQRVCMRLKSVFDICAALWHLGACLAFAFLNSPHAYHLRIRVYLGGDRASCTGTHTFTA